MDATARPIILTVDDEPDVLRAVERDLRQHFRSDYRVVRVGSGREALATTEQLRERDSTVALFLTDERMPEMSGTEFLSEARKIYPDARKVLLTAYADTSTAIDAINAVGLDHCLMKPWDPPDERLFPVLDGLLAEWQQGRTLAAHPVRIAGMAGSPESLEACEFMTRHQISYQWIDVQADADTRALVEALSPGLARLPVVFFPDGTNLVQPSDQKLAARLDLPTGPA